MVGVTGVAFNKKTGKKVWSGKLRTKQSYCSPTLINYQKQKRVIFVNSDSLNIVQPMTGKVLLQYPRKNMGADPIVLDQKLLLTHMSEGSLLLDLSQKNPQTIWKNKELKFSFQGLVLWQNLAFGFGRAIKKSIKDDVLKCFDINDGSLKWEHDLGAWGSLCIVGDKLVIVTGNGNIVIAKVSPQGFSEIATKQVFSIDKKEVRRANHGCWTIPAFFEGKVYVRSSKGQVACVQL